MMRQAKCWWPGFFLLKAVQGICGFFERLVKRYGIPLVMYHDRHGSLHRNDSYWSLEEQLAGRQEPTQVGLALEALGIESIAALSPQAKGRIERLFGTLQDRLIAELGLEESRTFKRPIAFSMPLSRGLIVALRSAPRIRKSLAQGPPELDLDRMISFLCFDAPFYQRQKSFIIEFNCPEEKNPSCRIPMS